MSTVLTSSQRVENLDSDSRRILIGTPSPSSNTIRTSKYTLLTFLPRNLFEQFHRLAYLYFLVIAVLNQLPQVAVFGRGASLLPLSFVLLVTALKDAFEDRRRHLSDNTENNRPATLLKNIYQNSTNNTPVNINNRSATGDLFPKSINDNSDCSDPFVVRSVNNASAANSFNDIFVKIKSKNIRVGDVIRVCSNETIPADIVLLSTSEPSGVCYVQTINLDGESNLKTRYAKQETIGKFPDFSGMEIQCERPNRNIYGFQAYLEIEGRRVSLGPSNILLRGCQVKNTEWVVGVVVYTGSETKVMMNSSGAPSKRSRLETHMNRETLFLSGILLVQCLVVCILNGVWLVQHEDELELDQFFRKKDYSSGSDENYNYYGVPMTVFIIFLMAVIVFQTMIPISLYISMELVRVGQAYFMGRDSGLYDESSNSRFQCRALNINEDLGQIKYVFSDKTGTLTENKMVFQCACIGGVDYGATKALFLDESNNYSVVVGNQIWRPKLSLKTNPELVKLLRSEPATEEVRRAREFFLALAACNTIVPLVVDTPDPNQKLIDYQGESPDEQALVYAAAAYGFILIERTSGHISIDVLGDRQRFEVLGLHEFDSDRKRMSVIIGCSDKTVKLFVKGADSSMLAVLDRNVDSDIIRATQQNLHTYSSLGLRTLVIGMRELSRNEFVEWQSAYERASTALLGRAALLRNVAADVESNLHILGASAIEDKLQQGVPEAIESLRQAAIKVWVLTGDKQETAISIGYSCKLLTNEMEQIVINSNSRDSCKMSLQDAVTRFSNLAGSSLEAQSNIAGTSPTNVPLALIIDGTSLVYILETELEEELFKIATVCDVVLCCRVAPLQKAGIVALIKNRTDDMTLAIGDGANDVSMIQMADVGIGISGQEGRQAVMASDFAMGQFRFLVPLLLVHGHWNYQRMAYMILYNFYRNSTFVFVLFWYVLYTAFTLTTAITEWSSVLYSVIYTSVPTIAVGILDKDLSRRTLLKYPQLYASGQKEEKYNLKLFILTMMDSVWQSLVVFYIPYLAYRHSTVDGSSLGDLWTLAVVILVNIHLAMDVLRWSWITHASVWGSIIATAISVIAIDAISVLPGYWAIFHIMGTGEFWLCILSIVVVGMVPRFSFKSLFEHLTPNDIHRAREVEKFGNSISANTASEIPMRTILESER